jgi:hypothetical protein
MKTLTDYGTGRIVVVTTHHGDVLKCYRVLIALREGRVAWRGDPQQYAEPLDTACG